MLLGLAPAHLTVFLKKILPTAPNSMQMGLGDSTWKGKHAKGAAQATPMGWRSLDWTRTWEHGSQNSLKIGVVKPQKILLLITFSLSFIVEMWGWGSGEVVLEVEHSSEQMALQRNIAWTQESISVIFSLSRKDGDLRMHQLSDPARRVRLVEGLEAPDWAQWKPRNAVLVIIQYALAQRHIAKFVS